MTTISISDLRRDCEAGPPKPYWHEPSNSKGLGTIEFVSAIEAERQRRNRDEGNAFLRLALAQRKMSHGYRHWARSAALNGNEAEATRCHNEADRLARDARWHLSRARMRGL